MSGDKLSRYQATLQLMHLIKQRKDVCEALLPDREILSVADVEAAAATYRENKAAASNHWLNK
jgi:hypothetical protein